METHSIFRYLVIFLYLSGTTAYPSDDLEITQVNGYDMVRLVNGGYIDNEENTGEPHKNKTTPADFLPTKKISYFCTLNFWYEFKRKIIIVFHCF